MKKYIGNWGLRKITCVICGKQSYKNRDPRRIGQNKYCSINCRIQGQKNRWFKGGIKVRNGYVLIYSPKNLDKKGKYIFEHRLIMEKHLGRYLKSSEIVHHKNGVTIDNRIENLKLFKNSSEHTKFHCQNKE